MNALEPGSTLGAYRILARLRAGAMGVLYLARRTGSAGFSRPVAIKVIHDHLAQNKRFGRMFIDEAKLSARIDDPNVVRVEEFGQADGRYYLVMEYVHGASLAQTIGILRKRGGIPMDHAVALAMQIASGLHGAHEATDEQGNPLGIVHRDVSPHNVLVSYMGYVRVIDFGIAKAREVGGQTRTGSLRGKLAYMPPEQARSARTVDRRADLYGVGLILWEMLTLRRVFDASTDIAILNQIRSPDIKPPSSLVAGVPSALDDIVMRTLHEDPAGRPATGAALVRGLGDAFPAALRVMPGDLAALMKKVRAAAEAAAAGAVEDDEAAYGEEVRGTIRTFSANMPEAEELPSDVLRTSGPSTEDDTTASPGPPVSPPPVPAAPPLPPPVVPGPRVPTARMVIEDEKTAKRMAPARASTPGGALLRPADGVRALAPSSADLGIPPAPHSSSRALAPAGVGSSPSAYGDVVSGRASSPSSPALSARDAPGAGDPQAEASARLGARQKIMLAVAIPVVAATIIAFAVVMGSPNAPAKPPVAALPPREAAAPVKSVAAVQGPALIAPVVIAPPEPEVVEEPDAATSRPGRQPRRGAAK